MYEIIGWAMLLRLILEIMHLIPNIEEQIKAALVEVHSTDSTGTKVANIATIAAAIASSAAIVVDDGLHQVEKK
jgi:hypothetical protein